MKDNISLRRVNKELHVSIDMEKSNNFLLPDSCPEDYLQEYGGAKPEDCSLIVSRCKDVIPEIGDAVHLGFYYADLFTQPTYYYINPYITLRGI